MIHCLLSYWAFKNAPRSELEDLRAHVRLFADSGAFSAATLGAKIRLAEYVQWLHQNADLFDVYANLDVIGDPVRSARNLKILEAEGLCPLPVYHVETDIAELRRLAERYRHLAFGQIVPNVKRKSWLNRRLTEAFSITEPAGIAVHGFGVGSIAMIRRFPWASVDATTYSFANRTHQVIHYDPYRKRLVQHRPYEQSRVRAALQMSKQYGISPVAIVAKRQSNDRYVAAILQFIELERAIAKDRRGFRYYFGVDRNPTVPALLKAAAISRRLHGDQESEIPEGAR